MDDWIKAGRIAAEVREWSRTLVKPGAKLLDIAEAIEEKIREKDAIPAFPVNLSMNEVAAHYTPVKDDPTILEDQVIKVDIGTCYNGAIGDTAYTVDLSGKYTDLVKASREALTNATKVLQIGTTLGEIGRTINETIQSHGFEPIRNLSGHGLGNHSVHMPPSIPNYDTGDKTELSRGQTIAIEPFATNGAGAIKEGTGAMIFSQVGNRPVRSPFARKLMGEIKSFNNLPFASRWLKSPGVNLGMRELIAAGNVHEYPPLPEIQNGIVSQAEHSFIIDDKVIVTTDL